MFIVPVARHAMARVEARADQRPYARLLDDSIDRYFAATGSDGASVRNPALDVVESASGYTVKLDMPGVTKEEVKVTIDGRHVSVQAQSAKADERVEGESLVYRERSAASYARAFKLAVELDPGGAVAKLENGVLSLSLPKRNASSAAQVAVS